MSYINILRSLIFSAFLLSSGFVYAAETSININTANVVELMQLKGIGEAKASAIVKYREEKGPFTSKEDLSKVRGIGDATVEKNIKKISI